MEKLNISEASAIVGGGCNTCSVQYIATGTMACNVVTTCTDKYGTIVSKNSTPATSLADCGIVVIP